MSDNTTNRGPRDTDRVNLSGDYEVRYWTQKFGVSKEGERAVERTGGMVKDVQAN